MTLNKEKCVFRKESVKCLGQIIKGDGICADPEKTDAVCKMPRPSTITELKRFMGMVNQLSKFSPNIARIAQPLCELLSTKSSWVWGPAQEEAFRLLKQICPDQQYSRFQCGDSSVFRCIILWAGGCPSPNIGR